MAYSAKTMVDVIQKYRPDIVIEFPTRRKYLEHLISNNPDLSAIPAQDFLLQEQHNREIYKNRMAIIRNEMNEWIKKQTQVVIQEPIFRVKWPGSWEPRQWRSVERSITKVTNDYVIIDDRKFMLDPNRLGWYVGESFIKYEPQKN